MLDQTQALNLSALAKQPIAPQTKTLLDSCGCGSYILPVNVGDQNPRPSLASQIFNLVWSYGWGIKSAKASYVTADNLAVPEPYCCTDEIPVFTGGSICEQEVKLNTFVMSHSTCLLNQVDACGPNGYEAALTEESMASMMVAKAMQTYIAYLTVNGYPELGIQGLRNTPGIQTYNIQNYTQLNANGMLTALNGVWALTTNPFSNMLFDYETGGNDWVVVGGRNIINYLRNFMFPDALRNVWGAFTGSCEGMCRDMGMTLSPQSVIVDPNLDTPAEIYLIRRNAASLVINLFDDSGNLSANGSMIHACPPYSGANCLEAQKFFYFRYGGILLNGQNDIIRIRFSV
jgi:hypothetical protein